MKKLLICLLASLITNIANAQWQSIGMDTVNVRCLVTSDSTIFIGAQGGVYISTDYGTTWTFSNNGIPSYVGVYSIATNGTDIFIGTQYTPGVGGIYLSTNGGSSWNLVNNGLTNTNINSLIIDGTTIFAGTEGGAFKSNNNGSSWTSINSGLPNSAFYSFAINGTDAFVGTQHGVFLSTNGGNSWTSASTGLTDSSIYSLVVNGPSIYAGAENGVFTSTNNGSFWSSINTGITDSIITALAINGTQIFAGTANDGVFVSNNNGNSWTTINTGLPLTNIYSLAISGTNIYTVLASTTFFKIRKRPLSEITEVEESKKYTPVLIYPNPGNGHYNIQLTTRMDNAKIEVYNLLGELVLNETKINTQTTIDLREQPNGIYILKAHTENGQTYTQRLIKQN